MRPAVRSKIILLLLDEKLPLFTNRILSKPTFLPPENNIIHVLMYIGDFTDIMCAEKHIKNVSRQDHASPCTDGGQFDAFSVRDLLESRFSKPSTPSQPPVTVAPASS